MTEQSGSGEAPGVSFHKQQSSPGGGYPQAPPSGVAVPPGFGPQPGYGMPPAYGYRPGPPPFPKPSSNIGWAIAAVFLFWPLCIPSFISSGRVDSAWYAGDWFGAKKASDEARKFGLIGVCIGGGLLALWLLFIVLAVALAV